MPLGYTTEPTQAEVEATPGALVLEFGDNDCGICSAARPVIDQALATRPGTPHRQIADGRGRRLGRAFGIKLWPTLVFLQDGREVGRLVRPAAAAPIAQALQTLTSNSP